MLKSFFLFLILLPGVYYAKTHGAPTAPARSIEEYTDEDLARYLQQLFDLVARGNVALINNEITLFVHIVEEFYEKLIRFSPMVDRCLHKRQNKQFYNAIAQLIIWCEKYLHVLPDCDIDLSLVKKSITEKEYREKYPMFFAVFDALSIAARTVDTRGISAKNYNVIAKGIPGKGSVTKVFETFDLAGNYAKVNKCCGKKLTLPMEYPPNGKNAQSEGILDVQGANDDTMQGAPRSDVVDSDVGSPYSSPVVPRDLPPVLQHKRETEQNGEAVVPPQKKVLFSSIVSKPLNPVLHENIAPTPPQSEPSPNALDKVSNATPLNEQLSADLFGDGPEELAPTGLPTHQNTTPEEQVFVQNIEDYFADAPGQMPPQQDFHEMLVENVLISLTNIRDNCSDAAIINRCERLIHRIEQAIIKFRVTHPGDYTPITLAVVKLDIT